MKAVDVLARRTRLAFLDSEAAKAAAPRVVKIMGRGNTGHHKVLLAVLLLHLHVIGVSVCATAVTCCCLTGR